MCIQCAYSLDHDRNLLSSGSLIHHLKLTVAAKKALASLWYFLDMRVLLLLAFLFSGIPNRIKLPFQVAEREGEQR